MPSIQDISPETLGFVTSELSADDLLNFGLTSKRLLSNVKKQLEFRVIDCRLGHVALWKLLAKDQHLAQGVRELSIHKDHHDYDCRVPPSFKDKYNERSSDLTAERNLVKALKNMSNLVSFTWVKEQPVINTRVNHKEPEDIWTALRKYTKVERLNISDFEGWSGKSALAVHYSKIWELSHLKSFIYRTHSHCSDRHGEIDLTQMTDMLVNRCPDLGDLNLWFGLDYNDKFPSANVEQLLATAKWPSLQKLALRSAKCTSETIHAFLANHPTLDLLYLPYEFDLGDDLNQRKPMLPNLETLDCTSTQATVLIPLLENPASLKDAGTFKLDDVEFYGHKDACDNTTQNDVFRQASTRLSLDRIKIEEATSPKVLERLAESSPELKILYVKHSIGVNDQDKVSADEWIRALSKFKHVEDIYGIYNDGIGRDKTILKKLIRACPSLQSIGGHKLDEDTMQNIFNYSGEHVPIALDTHSVAINA